MTERAVVVGAGVAGLAAAAAVRRHVDEVLVLERDTAGGPRRGVAQVEQLHNLLRSAQEHLEAVLPGFGAAVRAHGADEADVASQTHVWESGVRMPLRSLGFPLLSASWVTLERALLDVLPPDIRVERDASVDGLLVDGNRVTGVTAGEGRCVRADVVVVATGARTVCNRWLVERALPAPELEETQVNRWYVTLEVQRPPGRRDDPCFWLAFSTPPATRGLLVSPHGPSRWRVSASGGSEVRPPRSLSEVQAHARLVGDGAVADVLDGATALGECRLFRKPVVRRHRYDRLVCPPEGLWPVGDAVASLNPLLGQGVSVAAWQAALMAESCPSDATSHHRRTAVPVQAAVDLTHLDAPVHDTAGRRVDGHVHLAALASAVEGDAELHDLYVRMWHLLVPVRELLSPAVVDRARHGATTILEKVSAP